jgi:hypothetical protein
MENTWVASQVGMGVVIKSATGTTAADAKPNQGSTDLSFRWNDLRNMHRGFNVQGTDCSAERCVDNVKVTRVAVEQNRITGIGTSNGTGPSDAWFFPTSDNPSDVLYRHNTFVGNTPGYGIHIYLSGMSGGKFQRMAWIDNVLAHQGSYAIAGDGAPGCCKAAFDYYVTGGRYDHNVVSAVEGSFQTPTGNFYTTTQAALGLTTDFALPAGSPYKGKASDGKDPGADIPALIAATSGVVVQSAMQARARQPRPAKPLPRVRYTAADSAWCRRNACLPAPRRR